MAFAETKNSRSEILLKRSKAIHQKTEQPRSTHDKSIIEPLVLLAIVEYCNI